jgi:hypothetical protein
MLPMNSAFFGYSTKLRLAGDDRHAKLTVRNLHVRLVSCTL